MGRLKPGRTRRAGRKKPITDKVRVKVKLNRHKTEQEEIKTDKAMCRDEQQNFNRR